MSDIPVQITLVVDNISPPELLNEHGFSAWVEAGDQRILFDTGQGMALEHNAQRLGVDLSQATALVLSHGHYDHTGGIPTFLAANSSVPVFFGQGLSDCRYSCHSDHPVRAIGIGNVVERALTDLPTPRRVQVNAPRYLAPSIGISGPIPRRSSFEDTGGPFFLDERKEHADTLDDERAMWFETRSGLVVLTGCCHAGLVNTVNHIRETSGIERVHGIVGGLHLLNASAQRLEQTERFIADCAPDFLIPCHCTGPQVMTRLLEVFGADCVKLGQAGQTYEIGVLADTSA